MEKRVPTITSKSVILRVPTIEELNRRIPPNDERIRRAARQAKDLLGDIITPVRQRRDELRTAIKIVEKHALETHAISDVINLELRIWQSKRTRRKGLSRRHDAQKRKRTKGLWRSKSINPAQLREA